MAEKALAHYANEVHFAAFVGFFWTWYVAEFSCLLPKTYTICTLARVLHNTTKPQTHGWQDS